MKLLLDTKIEKRGKKRRKRGEGEGEEKRRKRGKRQKIRDNETANVKI